MTREALIRENEALHGLLAHACEALAFYADPGTYEFGEPEEEEVNLGTEEKPLFVGVVDRPLDDGDRARAVLAQIKEGVVP